MRAISLTQPWASLVAIGAKQWETRSWATAYRGQVAIHASKNYPRDCRDLEREPHFFAPALGERAGRLPQGSIIALADLTDCRPTGVFREKGFTRRDRDNTSSLIEISAEEYRFGNFGPDRYAFRLERVLLLQQPIACRGALSLWAVPDDVVAQVFMQITDMQHEEAIRAEARGVL